MNSSTYKLFYNEIMLILYTLYCTIMIITYNTCVISSTYISCLTYIRMSKVIRIKMRRGYNNIRISYHNKTWHEYCKSTNICNNSSTDISISNYNCTMRLLSSPIRYSIFDTME